MKVNKGMMTSLMASGAVYADSGSGTINFTGAASNWLNLMYNTVF